MAHAVEEIEEIISKSKAVILNPGTLDAKWLESLTMAARIAKKKKIVSLLDPVGGVLFFFSFVFLCTLIQAIEVFLLLTSWCFHVPQ
jgi:hydroxyethylthiazole kinase